MKGHRDGHSGSYHPSEQNMQSPKPKVRRFGSKKNFLSR